MLMSAVNNSDTCLFVFGFFFLSVHRLLTVKLNDDFSITDTESCTLLKSKPECVYGNTLFAVFVLPAFFIEIIT